MNPQSTIPTPPYTEAQTRHWLAWLARGMKQHGQTVFLIEQLQPSWLTTRSQLLGYTFSTRLIGSIIIGMTVGLIVGIVIGFAIGLVAGLIVSVLDMVRFSRLRQTGVNREALSLWLRGARILYIGLSIWLVTWLLGRMIGNALQGFALGLLFGVAFAATYGLRNNRYNLTNDIQTVEILSWSWVRALTHGVVGMFVGLVTGIAAELIARIAFQIPIVAFSQWWFQTGMLVGVAGGGCGAIFGGLTTSVVETKTAPNQGIRLSFRNCLLAGLIAGSIIGGISAVTGDYFGGLLVSLGGVHGLTGGLRGGLLAGLCGGLLVALWFGGLDIMQHSVLRLVLSMRRYAPLNYARFLDYATDELNFLQKVGGGYVFVHRYLLEHFEAMEEPR